MRSTSAKLSPFYALALSSARLLVRFHIAILFLTLTFLFSHPFTFYSSAQDFMANTLGDFGNVTVMEVAGNYDAKLPDGSLNRAPRQTIAKEFLKTHKDEYDFLVVFSNFDFQPLEKNTQAFYLEIKNDVQGIGRPIFNNSELYGSNGKLQGLIEMGSVANQALDPLDPRFDDILSTLSHEFLHRWGAHVRFKDSEGNVSTALLGDGDNHWSYLLNSDGSVHYGHEWRDNGNGTFTAVTARKYFSSLDLYLMGMIDKSQVPPMLLIENPGIDPKKLPEPGVTITGSARYVKIDDIIAAEGERIPGSSASQKNFKIGFIFVTLPGTFTGSELFGIESVRNGFVTRFSILNDGKGIVQTAATLKENLPKNPGITLPPVTPRTLPPDINEGVSWLMAHQQGDGSWRDLPQTMERDTSESLLALKSFAAAQGNYAKGLLWLQGTLSANIDYLARKVEVLAGSGGETATLVSELLSRQNMDGGWGSNKNYLSNPSDTALVLRTLAAIGYSAPPVLSKAIGYLKSKQNGDGGWGNGDGSAVQSTAGVVSAFGHYRAISALEEPLAKGVAFLLQKQNADGGFGNSPSTVYDTAISILALRELDVSTEVTNRGITYLLALQSGDGSWYGSPYQTALAVQVVLKATIDPDLSIKAADIHFIPAKVTSLPADLVVRADIWNLGRSSVPQAKVFLYDGAVSDQNKIGEQIVAFPGQSSVTVTFPATLADGNPHRYTISVDPEGLVKESNKLNNVALKVLTPETSYDFEIRQADVAVSAAPVNYFQEVTLSSKITNKGTTDAFNVPVRYYVNDPSGPFEIATAVVTLPAGKTVSNQVVWKANKVGTNLPIFVKVDPLNAFAELSEENNQASISLTVNPITGPNLTVSHQEIVVTPSPASEGGSARISAVVRNQGFSSASNFNVEIYRGVPGAGGVLIGSQAVASLNPGESQGVSAEWAGIAAVGEKIIYIQADPENRIAEISKEDNGSFTTLRILTLPDLALSTNSIQFTPSAPKEGDSVSIQVTVQNEGEQSVSGVPIRLYEGSTLLSDQVLPPIAGNSQGSVTFVYNTAGKNGPHPITAAVDPNNTLLERSKGNNQASRTFGVQNANLWLTEQYISPNGDGIKDKTDFFFRLQTPQKVSIAVMSEKGRVVRRFSEGALDSSAGGNVSWDGLDDKGIVVQDGQYQIQIRDPKERVLGSLVVVVDNNRSPLLRAIGTPYLLETRLNCVLNLSEHWRWLRDESGILFSLPFQNGFFKEFHNGIYSTSLNGGDPVQLTPFEWGDGIDPAYNNFIDVDLFSGLSPNGEKIAFSIVKFRKVNFLHDLSQLWVMDRDGQNLKLIDSYDLTNEGYIPFTDVTWSPDNQTIAYNADGLWIIKSDGTGKTKIDDNTQFSFNDLNWMGDGRHLIYNSTTFDQDTSSFTDSIILSAVSGEKQTVLSFPATQISIHPFDRQEAVVIESNRLWLVDTKGNVTKVSEHLLSPYIGDSVTFAPNGQLFAFSTGSNDSEPISIHISDSAGNDLIVEELQSPDASITHFVSHTIWSPDSTQIAFLYASHCRFIFDRRCLPFPDNAIRLVMINIKTGEKKTADLDPSDFSRDFEPIAWLSDGVSIFVTKESQPLIIDSVSGEIKAPALDISPIVIRDSETILSPLQRYVSYYTFNPTSFCYPFADLKVVSSLLNLTDDLQITKNTSAVSLKGTAADLNFNGYQLEYADAKIPGVWNFMAPPSDIPLVNGLFTTWVPPYEGTFHVRLTVTDKAGNTEARTSRVSWGISSSITNLYKSLDAFSPNGDGVKDTVELHYKAQQPVHLEFNIFDEKDRLVRTFLKDHPVPAEDLISWDGRDASGNFVPDGKYKMTLFDDEFFFTVDATPPDLSLTFGPINQTNDLTVYIDLLSHAVDNNMKKWVVEYGVGDNPQEWHELQHGEGNQVKIGEDGAPLLNPITDAILLRYEEEKIEWLVGKKLRMTAEDFAGNQRTVLTSFLVERMVLNEWHGAPFNTNSGVIEGQLGLGNVGAIETIREPISSATIEYQNDGVWHEGKTITSPLSGIIEFPWDSSALDKNRSYPIRMKATDIQGNISYSNTAVLGLDFVVRGICQQSRPTLSATNGLTDLVLLKFQMISKADPDYKVWTDLKVYDKAKGDPIPLGKFELFPQVKNGFTYQVRMIGADANGRIYNSVTDYPPSCGTLSMKVIQFEAKGCGVVSGKAVLSAELSTPPSGLLQSFTYYIDKPEGRQVLHQFDLTRESWGNIDVETSSLPEGVYPVGAVLTYLENNIVRQLAAGGSLLVDRVLPTAKLTHPGVAQRLCPQKVSDPAGEWFGISIEGIAADNNRIKEYRLFYGAGENPTTWLAAMTGTGKKATEIKGSGSLKGLIGNWNVTDLKGTTYTLKLEVVDAAGNIGCYTMVVKINAPIAITALAPDKTLFSPNGDGVLDSVSVSYQTDEAATVDVKVFKLFQNVDGSFILDSSAIRTIVSGVQRIQGTAAAQWDGKDNASNTVSDGKYGIAVLATDPCGNTNLKWVSVEVDNTRPSAVITYPRSSDPLGNVVEIRGTDDDLHFLNYVVEAGQGEIPGTWLLISSGAVPVREGLLGQWNTFGLDGKWTLRLTATDTVNNKGVATITVDLGARKNLVKGFSLSPQLFSPNGDGKLDVAEIRYELADPSSAKIEIADSSGVVKKTIITTVPSPGSYKSSWDGKNDGGVLVPDGDYFVRLTATLSSNSAVTQTEIVTVSVDTTPPLVNLKQPTDQFYFKTDVAVNGTIGDMNLLNYRISYTGETGGPILLDQANQSRESYPFGVLHDTPEGNYTLHILAKDLAENMTEKTISFTIDRTPPKAALDSPKEGAAYGGSHPTINIAGSLTEKNLDTFRLRFGAGEIPAVWTDLLTGGNFPIAPSLFPWKVGKSDGVPDGLYTLSLYAKDKAGFEVESKLKLIIDNTLPEVSITSLQEGGFVKTANDLKGTASDSNLDHYTVGLSEGVCAVAFKWVNLKTGTTSVRDGLLDRWEVLPEDGRYCLRLTAVDKVENKAELKLNFILDTHPPNAPVLTGKSMNKSDANLTWVANAESDLAGYNLYRDGQKINKTLIAAVEYHDLALSEGSYTYTLKAVDRAGWESAASNGVKMAVDLTGPNVKIRSPQEGSKVSGLIDVKGTASSDDFKQYRVYSGQGTNPSIWNLIRTSPLSTPLGMLTQWETAPLTEGIYSIKLEGEDLLGNISMHQIAVLVDNTPPAAPHLVLATLNGADVTVTWQTNGEIDLAGYLLYRNNQLANVSGVVVGDLKTHLIAGTHYLDKAVPDGTLTYMLVAMDQAGNLSNSSNTISLTLDAHPPHAVIVQPITGSRFESALLVQADSPDLDIASIQYQYKKPADNTWLNLGSAVTVTPSLVQLDPKRLGLAYGDYQLRAVAADKGGKVDPSPSPVSVTYLDLTPPGRPTGLTARERGAEVALVWTANLEGDLDGYVLYRTFQGVREKIHPSVVKGTAYTDRSLSDGEYLYEIAAVDVYGNESGSSADVLAKVYLPILSQPYTPTDQRVLSIGGENATPGGQVAFFNTAASESVPAGEVSADGKGRFILPQLSLAPGENRITARVTDVAGNVSKTADPIMVVYNVPPAAPTGLSASVVSHDVTLTWNENTEPDLAGYNLYRRGTKVNQPVAVTAGEVAGISSEYSNFIAASAFDGDPATSWSSFYPFRRFTPRSWEIGLVAPVLINHLEIHWETTIDSDGHETVYAGKEFEVQFWSGDAWITQRKVTGNDSKENRFDIAPPYRTDKIRIYMTEAADPFQIGIAEVNLLRDYLIGQASYEDLNLPDRKHVYTLAAVDLYGFEGASSDPASIIVGDVIAPAAPTGLSTSVSGSDVRLQWNLSTESDLAGYHLYRNNGDGFWVKVNQNLITIATFIDFSLLNGSYRYRATALDVVGNESDPSAEVSAAVAIPIPPPPVQLAAGAPLQGGSLDLVWLSSDPTKPVAGYLLFRSMTPGGPSIQINPAPIMATSYRDAVLTNGVTYYYRVRAVDSAGNLSTPSNEASGTPRDTFPPAVPTILYPADAMHPRTVTTDKISVSGVADQGTSVNLLIDGILVDTVPVLSTPTSEPFTLPSQTDGAAAFFSGESLLSYFSTPPAGRESVLTMHDVVNHLTRYFNAIVNGKDPIFSMDGTKIAFVSNENGIHVSIFDRRSGSVSQTIDLPASISGLSFSPDGTKIALALFDNPLSVLDLAAGTVTPLTTDPGFYPTWSPDGTQLAYITFISGGIVLRMTDSAGLVHFDVDSQVVFAPAAFSADGKRLIYTSMIDSAFRFYDLESSRSEHLLPPGPPRFSPLLSPDGTSLVYFEQETGGAYTLRMRRFSDGEVSTLASHLQVNPIFWGGDGTLIYLDGRNLLRILPSGHFQSDGFPLHVGRSFLTAVAVDTAGNKSASSDPVVVTLDTSGRTDLAVSETDLFVYPLFPIGEEPVRMAATVRNLGQLSAQGVEVAFFSSDSKGASSQIGPLQTIASLPPGEEATVFIDWPTVGLLGRYTLTAVVDPLDKIDEVSEFNNLAGKEVIITQTGSPTLLVTTDQAVYPPDGTVQVSLEAANPAFPNDFVLDLLIEDLQGNVVSSLLHETLSAFGYASRGFTESWSGAGVLSGAYRAHAVLTQLTGEKFEAVAPFTLLADQKVLAKVVTDRASYRKGEPIQVTETVQNLSLNADLTGLTTLTRVLDAQGVERFRSERSLETVLVGARIEHVDRWTAADPGQYTVRFAIRSTTEEIASSTATFNTAGSAVLEGHLKAIPPVSFGGAFTLSADVANTGTLDLNGVTLRLLLIDPDRQATLHTFERIVNLPVGQPVTWEISDSAVGLGLKDYLVRLQIQEGSGIKNLASGTLSVVDRQAPAIEILSPTAGIHVNHDVAVTVHVTDEASGVDRVEYQVNGGAWTPMAPADFVTGRYRILYPANSVTEGMRTLAIRASDKAGNNDQTSLSDPNPVTVQFVVDVTPPQIDLSGIADGLVVNHDLLPVIRFTDLNLGESGILLNGIPYGSGTPIAAERSHLLEMISNDIAGNTTRRVVQFTIDNTPPSVTISGASDGQYAKVDLTPVVTVSDPHLASSTLLLDGSPFVSGTTLAAEKSYVLDVTAQDTAGNNRQTAVHFTIDKTAPSITVAGVSDGATYSNAVTPVISVTDRSVVAETISLNGVPFVSGNAIDTDGQYTLEVLASDPAGNSASRIIHFTVTQNRPPVAIAGPDQNVIVGQLVTLNGTASSDPDSDQITYHWTVLQIPSGSAIATSSLSSSTGPKPTFTPDVVGTYLIELFVADGKVNSGSDQITVLAERPPNVPPNASAGPDQNVLVNSMVLLSGTGSADPDHGPQPLTYSWSFISVPVGSKLTTNQIAGKFTVNANFAPDVAGSYTVRLTVSDGLNSSFDDLLIKASGNTPPVSNAGPDISIKLKQTANLDGSASKDPDLRPSPLTYSWSFVSKPSYSKLTNANIQNRNQAKAFFIPDVRGTYVLSLTASDGGASSSDNVAVTVRPVRVYGEGNFKHGGSDEKFSCDVRDQSGVVESSSWIKYAYAKANINSVATQLSSIDVTGNTVTITGTFSVNGASGYRFVATITDGAPDLFSITIYRPNGAVLYQYSSVITLGSLIIEE